MSASASYYSCATVDGIWSSEKTLDLPFLAYYGCSKLLKARAVFYWGTHTRFTVSVGIDPSLTKTRRCICMDKRARISPLWELYIIRIRASYTSRYVRRNILLRFYGISHACANSGAQAVFSLPRKKTAWERGYALTGARLWCAIRFKIADRSMDPPIDQSIRKIDRSIR